MNEHPIVPISTIRKHSTKKQRKRHITEYLF